MREARNIIDRVRAHAQRDPSAQALQWLPELSHQPAQHLDRQALWAEVERIAGGLLALDWPAQGPRVALLAFPAGPEFACSFLGCLAAGVIAVPVALPRRGQPPDVLDSIVRNCRPALALSTPAEALRLRPIFAASAALAAVPVQAHDALPAARWIAPVLPDDAVAFLQYTSGSGSRPKGVCVSHANLMANLELTRRSFGFHAACVMVSWLPHYHDMGLIGSLLQPLHGGFPLVGMAPAAFIKRPLRWLQAIGAQSPERDVVAGGPNFAYQLCADRTPDHEARALSLGRWVTAFNGAEPVRAQTLDAFSARFAAAGFRRASFYPCYGLAESTLFVAGTHAPPVLHADAAALERGRADEQPASPATRALVSSGIVEAGRVLVVDPAARAELPQGHVGEIWVTGPSVPRRYFDDPAETERTFQAHLPSRPGERFLATGDLGLVRDGHLYITGRARELLIVHGRNIHPHDVQSLLQEAAAEAERIAVFAWRDATTDAERTVAICEVSRAARHLLAGVGADPVPEALQALASRLRDAAASLELVLDHVRFVPPGGLTLTTSGKAAYGELRRGFGALPASERAEPTSAAGREPAPAGAHQEEDAHEPRVLVG